MWVRMWVRDAIKLHEMPVKVPAAVFGVGQHPVESVALGPEGVDLPNRAVARIDQQGTALARVSGGPKTLSIALADRLVLQQLPDLEEAETGVVAELLDEPQALQVARVEQAVGPVRAARRLQQAELLVVTDGPGGKAGLSRDFLDAAKAGGRIGHPPMLPQP